MFDKYHYAKQNGDFIIYEAKNVDDGSQMSLYVNGRVIDSITGLLGEFRLGDENVSLVVKNTALKSTHELTHKGSVIDLQKVKLKALKQELAQANINNDINPTSSQIEAGKFKWSKLLLPALLVIAGLGIQYFVQGMDRKFQLIAMIVVGIAGSLLFDVFAERSSWLREYRKGRIGFIVILAVLVTILGELLFQYF